MVIAARLPFVSLGTTAKSLYPIQEKKTQQQQKNLPCAALEMRANERSTAAPCSSLGG
jgi:hypothetical protein